MFDKFCKTAIRESLNIESLFGIERSQHRWLGHASRVPEEWLPKHILYAKVSWKKPVVRPRTRLLNCIDNLCWNRLGLHPSKMQSVLVDRELWRLNLELLTPQPSRKIG